MINLTILVLLVIWMFLLLYLTKDIVSAPVVLTVSWAIPFLFLTVSEGIGKGGYDIGIIGFYFLIGVIVFSIGYFCCNKLTAPVSTSFSLKENRSMTVLLKVLIITEFIVTVIWIYDVYRFVKANFQYNFWFTYKWNVSMGFYTDNVIIVYLRTATRVFSCIMFVQFLSYGHNKKDTKWFLVQLGITATLNLLGQGRGGIFSFIIPMTIIYIMLRVKTNYKIIRVGCRVIVLLLAIFIIYAQLKSPYETDKVPMLTTIENYLCGGIVAFERWASSGSIKYANGLYTFRFFLAILHAFGFNVPVVKMAEDYVTNIHGNIGNVYTFYKWYANDFGLLYAMVWQFIIGSVHGCIAKTVRRKRNEVWLVIYAMSFYPLIMQFFMDEYITKLSTWIQIFFWIFLILKTNLFYRRCSVVNNDTQKIT